MQTLTLKKPFQPRNPAMAEALRKLRSGEPQESPQAKPKPPQAKPKPKGKGKPTRTEKTGLAWQWATSTFPAAFTDPPRPLAIGIHDDLRKQVPANISKTSVRWFMSSWTRAWGYRPALAAGGPRYGLDGKPAGMVTPEQQEYAREGMERIKASTARRQASTSSSGAKLTR